MDSFDPTHDTPRALIYPGIQSSLLQITLKATGYESAKVSDSHPFYRLLGTINVFLCTILVTTKLTTLPLNFPLSLPALDITYPNSKHVQTVMGLTSDRD